MCGGTNSTLLVGTVVFDSCTTVTCIDYAQSRVHMKTKMILGVSDYCKAWSVLHAPGKQK